MPQVTAAALAASLRKRAPAAVYFLHGEEQYLRDEAATEIVAAFLDPSTRDFNHDQLRGSDVSAEALASVVATPPMMAEYRVVELYDAQGLSPKAREVVESVAASPPAGLVLVVTAAIPPQSKAKFYTTLQKLAISVEFAPVDVTDLPGWLTETARETHGLALDPGAARAIAAAIGSQLGILSSELRKLADYSNGRMRITLDDVRAVGGFVPRADRWEWLDLVVERRLAEALRQVPALLEAGEGAVPLLIALGAQLVRVGLVAAGGREALERQLKPYQRWLANRVVPAARGWTLEEVDDCLEELLRTDRHLKTTSLTDRQAIEELLLRLSHRLTARNAA